MAKIDKLVKQAKEHLAAGESVIAAVQGTYEGKSMGEKISRAGILVATEQRVVFYAKKMGGYDFESFPYGNISSFEQGKSMMGRSIRFSASGNEVQLKWVSDADAFTGFVEVVRDKMSVAKAPPPPPPPPPPPTAAAPAPAEPVASDAHDLMEQLKKLGELRDAGVLTDEEFAAKKSDLLSRI